MAKLTAAKRNKIPKSQFGLPGERKYPMPDPSHAQNAKGRATQQVKAGRLSPSSAARIREMADRVIARGHHRTSSGRMSFHSIQHPGHKEKMK